MSVGLDSIIASLVLTMATIHLDKFITPLDLTQPKMTHQFLLNEWRTYSTTLTISRSKRQLMLRTLNVLKKDIPLMEKEYSISYWQTDADERDLARFMDEIKVAKEMMRLLKFTTAVAVEV